MSAARSRVTASTIAWVSVLIVCGTAAFASGATSWSDEPDPVPEAAPHPGRAAPRSYEDALRTWKTPEDIAAWAASRFAYDIDRALAFSESARLRGNDLPVWTPPELFVRPIGTCLDFARFGYETLQQIDPAAGPTYLMIEFEPVNLRGHTLRRHWVVSFRRGGSVYVFSDSKRPWLVDGPHATVGAFIESYETYRGRRIVRFLEVDTYRRQKRSPREQPAVDPGDQF